MPRLTKFGERAFTRNLTKYRNEVNCSVDNEYDCAAIGQYRHSLCYKGLAYYVACRPGRTPLPLLLEWSYLIGATIMGTGRTGLPNFLDSESTI